MTPDRAGGKSPGSTEITRRRPARSGNCSGSWMFDWPSKPSGLRTSSSRRSQKESRAGIGPGAEPAPAFLSTRNIFTQPRVTQSLVCAESVMPLSSEQEALCRRLEMGRPEPSAAALIRQQARDIDELWDRLSRAYLAVRREIPSDELRREIEDLRVKLARGVP